MTLLEPFILGAIVSYIMTPLASYALGIDPSLSIQYLCIVTVAPLVLGIPALLPVAVIYEAIFGGLSDLERLCIAALGIGGSIAAFLMVSWWYHAPETPMRTLALVVSSPFIGGVVAAIATGIAVAAASLTRSLVLLSGELRRG